MLLNGAPHIVTGKEPLRIHSFTEQFDLVEAVPTTPIIPNNPIENERAH
jgi:hypothetical protein